MMRSFWWWLPASLLSFGACVDIERTPPSASGGAGELELHHLGAARDRFCRDPCAFKRRVGNMLLQPRQIGREQFEIRTCLT
jgi:hypothetical protein